LIGTNPHDVGIYLKLLAGLSRLLNNKIFLQDFSAAKTPQELMDVFNKHEK